MRLYNMIGYKLYKVREDDTIHMVRIVNMRRPFKITKTTPEPAEITILDYDDNTKKKVRVDSLKEYHPIKPDGIFTASIVNVIDKDTIYKDVIVTGSKYLNLEYQVDILPYCVCRQSITDIFYTMLSQSEDDTLVGLSVNQETCPSNFDYGYMLAVDKIDHSEFINFYRTDTLDDILTMVRVTKFDKVLNELFTQYIKSSGKINDAFKNESGGWCKNLKTLLYQNNFQADLNQMLGITDLDFELEPEFVAKTAEVNGEKIEYYVASDELKYWLSLTFRVDIKEISFVEFDHDINLADYNNARYLLLRGSNKKLYLAVYTISGEFLEADLIEKDKELDFSSKFRLAFFIKYKNKDVKNNQ